MRAKNGGVRALRPPNGRENRYLVLAPVLACGYSSGMTRAAAHKLARLLRAQGFKVRITRHPPMRGRCFYTVHTR